MGLKMLNQNDIAGHPEFEDEVAFGGFYIDLHTTGGLLADNPEPVNAVGWENTTADAIANTYIAPYGFPLRCMISKDISNLMMAGRNASVTHVALGSIRPMMTTAVMGQGAGTAAAFAVRKGVSLKSLLENGMSEVKQQLLKDGCFLPHNVNQDPGDFALKASVTASSTYEVTGHGPDDRNKSTDNFPNFMKGRSNVIEKFGQWIAISEDKFDSVSLLLGNDSDKPILVRASIVEVDDIWDYCCDDSIKKPIAETFLTIAPGLNQWVTWNVGLDSSKGLIPGKYIRINLDANKNLYWYPAGSEIIGHSSAHELRPGRMKSFNTGGGLSFKVTPSQFPFGPKNIISGVTRPHKYTNLWLSDKKQDLPAWIQLEWEKPQQISEIQITFPGNLNFEYGSYPALYREPLVAKEYSVLALVGADWVEVARETDNFQCRRSFVLAQPIEASKIKVIIYKTNGEEYAGITEVRCY